MKGHGSKFGRKQEEAIAALLTHRSMEDAARAAGIGVTTLLRWQQIPEFAAKYRKARRAAVSQATARLHGMETEDIEVRVSDLERAADLSKSSGRFSASDDVPTIHYDEHDR